MREIALGSLLVFLAGCQCVSLKDIVFACDNDTACLDSEKCIEKRCVNVDSGVQDSGAQDSGAQDSGVQDSGVQDSGAQDSGAQDSGAQDSGVQDAGVQDSGVQDSGVQDAGLPDAGIQDSGFALTSSLQDHFSFYDANLWIVDPQGNTFVPTVSDAGQMNFETRAGDFQQFYLRSVSWFDFQNSTFMAELIAHQGGDSVEANMQVCNARSQCAYLHQTAERLYAYSYDPNGREPDGGTVLFRYIYDIPSPKVPLKLRLRNDAGTVFFEHEYQDGGWNSFAMDPIFDAGDYRKVNLLFGIKQIRYEDAGSIVVWDNVNLP
jgi:hypothetical protein